MNPSISLLSPTWSTTSESNLVVRERHMKALEMLSGDIRSVLEPRDVVPALFARRALLSKDMTLIYSKKDRADRVDLLLSIITTKDHWWGPLIDSLIRSGRYVHIAERLLETSSGLKAEISGFVETNGV